MTFFFITELQSLLISRVKTQQKRHYNANKQTGEDTQQVGKA
jgi:hypothetical protein